MKKSYIVIMVLAILGLATGIIISLVLKELPEIQTPQRTTAPPPDSNQALFEDTLDGTLEDIAALEE